MGETQPLVSKKNDPGGNIQDSDNSRNILWPPRPPSFSSDASGQGSGIGGSTSDNLPLGWRSRLSSKSNLETWNFPGWGSDMQMSVSEEELAKIAKDLDSRAPVLLDEFEATSICTNDILSSCLYVVGLVTSAAGKIAPLALLIVSF